MDVTSGRYPRRLPVCFRQITQALVPVLAIIVRHMG